MIANIDHKGEVFKVDLSAPIDISIPISPAGPRAWYVDTMRISPVISQQFTGSVKLGGSVNFNDIYFNPHGHGTHTESFGHIDEKVVSVNKVLTEFFFMAQLISIVPEVISVEREWQKKGDQIITAEQVRSSVGEDRPEALVIRTLPNLAVKKEKNYSATNFPYIASDALAWLASINIKHLLVDLPSVDRESDGGLLKAHHAFWQHPENTRTHCTITEFIYVDDTVVDGKYLLELQVAPFENDASPSRPLLFAIM